MNFSSLKDCSLNKWWVAPSTAALLPVAYMPNNDKALKIIRQKIDSFMTEGQKNGWHQDAGEALMLEVKSFMNSTLGISTWATDQLYSESYIDCTKVFIKRAKEIAPELSTDDLFQALRNVWTMNSMQIYLGAPIELTDSIFAYSMLYPLTDNYLDAPDRGREEKLEFNKRFREKIARGQTSCKTAEEARIFEMIDLIEGQFNRDSFPKVYEALLAILDGQTMSVDQQNLASVHDKDLVGITFYKGGSSVLCDAYLITGYLTEQQEQFAFDYGVMLQLADDLQDVRADLKAKHGTIFNQQCRLGLLDPLINKYLHMLTQFYNEHFQEASPKVGALKELIATSLNLLVMTAVIDNRKYISRSLFKRAKLAHVFSIKTYQATEKRLNRQLHHLAKA